MLYECKSLSLPLFFPPHAMPFFSTGFIATDGLEMRETSNILSSLFEARNDRNSYEPRNQVKKKNRTTNGPIPLFCCFI